MKTLATSIIWLCALGTFSMFTYTGLVAFTQGGIFAVIWVVGMLAFSVTLGFFVHDERKRIRSQRSK